MNDDVMRFAGQYLDKRSTEKLGEKMGDIGGLLESPDGKAVRDKLAGSGIDLDAAVKEGDMAALKGVLTGIVGTEEGARLVSRLREMFK
jgi:hypothetical protein